jgi:RNA polymerase sigma-70 factor (ECF subfamily)
MRDQKKINHPENLDFFESIEGDADTEVSAVKNLDKSILENTQRQTRQAISKAIESLAPKRQEAFRLCYLENFSYAEAAEIMGVSKKTVEHHMSLALADLREQLKKLI